MGWFKGWLYRVVGLFGFKGDCRMTEVTFLKYNDITYGFNMKGHACFNLKGPDIVCASLSATSQMTANGIMNWLDDDIIKKVDDGIFEVEIDIYKACDEVVEQLLSSFEVFIKDITQIYPENVAINYDERDVLDV